jgi:hypothetical protein
MVSEEKVTEVRETNDPIERGTVTRERTVSDADRVTSGEMARRVVYYIGGAIIALLAVRFVLALLGAAQGNPFVDFIYGLSSIFVWPFYGIFGEPTYGTSQFESSTLVAMVVYALLTVGIGRLFTLGSRDPSVRV